MKKSIILLLVIIALPVMAQNNRFYFGVYGSPDLSEFVVLKGEMKETVNELSKIRLAYTFGITSGFRINSFISFETGIQYSVHGSQSEKVSLVFEEPDPLLDGLEARTRMYIGYLGIPLKLRITGKSDKYFFTASAGIVPNYRIFSYSKYILYGDERSVEKSGYKYGRKFTLTPVISAGVGCHLSERSDLIIEPAFQYDLIPVSEDSHGHYWNLGLKMGLTFWL
jgi:hypothetical protein